MIRINLLPHRQIRRAERQREFELMCVLVMVAAASFLFMGWSIITAKVEGQQARNTQLQTQIGYLDKEIAAIGGLKEQIQRVLARKQIVENLQHDRNQAVSVLDELARVLPEGMHLKSIQQQGDDIELSGVADTNARIATLVHSLGQSSLLQNPNLVEIKASDPQPNVHQFEFVLKVALKHEITDVHQAPHGQAPVNAAAGTH